MRIATCPSAWLLGLVLPLVACGDGTKTAQPSTAPARAAPAPSSDEPEPATATPYERVIASIRSRGSSGARAAWAAGRPTLLLCAASW